MMNNYFVSRDSRSEFKGPIQGESPEEVLTYIYKDKDVIQKGKKERSAVMFGNDVFEYEVEATRTIKTEIKLTPVNQYVRTGPV